MTTQGISSIRLVVAQIRPATRSHRIWGGMTDSVRCFKVHRLDADGRPGVRVAGSVETSRSSM
jgi:hypothetical protein